MMWVGFVSLKLKVIRGKIMMFKLKSTLFTVVLLASVFIFFLSPGCKLSVSKEPQKSSVGKVSAKKSKPVEVRMIGFLSGGDRGADAVYAKVYNPNDDVGWELLGYSTSVYDANGAVLSTDDGAIGYLLPKEEKMIYSIMDVEEGKIVANTKIRFHDDKPKEMDTSIEPKITILGKEFSTDDHGDAKVTGELRNESKSNIDNLYLVVFLYDESKQVIGARFTFIDSVAAGSTVAYELKWCQTIQNVAVIEIQAEPSGLDDIEPKDK